MILPHDGFGVTECVGAGDLLVGAPLDEPVDPVVGVGVALWLGGGVADPEGDDDPPSLPEVPGDGG